VQFLYGALIGLFYFFPVDTYVHDVKKIFIHLGLLLLASSLWAQSNPAKKESRAPIKEEDALDMEKEEKVENREVFLLEEAQNKANSSPEEAIDLLERFFGMRGRNKAPNPSEDQRAYFLLGRIYMDLQRYPSAVDAFVQAEKLSIAAQGKSKKGRALDRYASAAPPLSRLEITQNLGLAHQKAGNMEDALFWLEEFQELTQKSGELDLEVRAENLLGNYWTQRGNSRKARKHYETAVQLSRGSDDKLGYANSLKNLGETYQTDQINDQARQNYQLANEAAQEIGDDTLVAQTYEQIAQTFEEENMLDSALIAENKALETRSNIGDTKGAIRQQNKISSLYLKRNEASEAIQILESSLALARQTGELEAQAEAHQLLAAGYEKRGEVDKALFHYKKARTLSDTLAAVQERKFKSLISKNDQIAAKDKKIATLLKEQELKDSKIEILQERQSFQLRILIILGLGFLVVSVSAFLVIRSNQARRKSNQLLALKSLRSQMNPHFIFNSLNSINGFIARHDDRTANKYLSDFSKLMRTVLDHSQQDFVSLATEMEVLKLYVKLEHFRFGDKFDYTLSVDPELKQEQIEIPPMLVQPYIENAIWHGLRYKSEKGFLNIEIKEKERRLEVLIEDDGIGRTKSAEIKTKNQRSHNSTGLKNTAQRVDIINEVYKSSLTVQIEDLHSDRKDTGTRVRILMPLRELSNI